MTEHRPGLLLRDSAATVSGDMLERLGAATEARFLDVGSKLERAAGELAKLRAVFADIETGLGPEAGSAFAAQVEDLVRRAGALTAALDEFVSRTEDLETASRRVAHQISDLDRVVRTIATLSITARVIGHALSPPDRKVAAFVESLSHMSAEAEAILSDVTGAMEQIRGEMQELPGCVETVRDLLRGQVLTQLTALTRVAQDLESRRPRLVKAGTELQAEMGRVSQEVGRLIVALQVGDSFRQRLGRVAETIRQGATLAHPQALAANHELAARLLSAAHVSTEQETRGALGSLFALDASAAAAVRTARDAYLGVGRSGPTAAELSKMGNLLDARLLEVDDLLFALQTRTDRVVEEVKEIFTRERTLRQIAQKVRLAGLNAIVICTQLGSRGNALREVAQWLRSMTDEADDATENLQTELGGMRELIDAVGVTGIGLLAEGTASVVEGGRAIHSGIDTTNGLIARASEEINRIGVQLPALLQPAQRGLNDFLTSIETLARSEQDLRQLGAGLPAPDLPFPEDSADAHYFAGLRAGYTMAGERAVHDDYLAGGGQMAAAGAPKTDPAAAPMPAALDAGGDFDDILF